MTENENEEEQSERSSKEELKQALAEAHDIAARLLSLNKGDLAAIDLDADILAEVIKAKDIKSNAAKSRQVKVLARAINLSGADAVRAALLLLARGNLAANRRFRALENLRDAIVAGDGQAIEAVLKKYPQADRQHLRNLQRNVKKEKNEESKMRIRRTIFEYLRGLSQAEPAQDDS